MEWSWFAADRPALTVWLRSFRKICQIPFSSSAPSEKVNHQGLSENNPGGEKEAILRIACHMVTIQAEVVPLKASPMTQK